MSDTRRSGRHWASLVGIHRAPPDPGGGDNPGWTHPLAGRDFFERIPPVEMVCLGRKGEHQDSASMAALLLSQGTTAIRCARSALL